MGRRSSPAAAGFVRSGPAGWLLLALAALLPAAPCAGQYQLLDIITPEFDGMPEQSEDDGPRFGHSVAASSMRLMVGSPKLLQTEYIDGGIIEVGAWADYRRQADDWPLEGWRLPAVHPVHAGMTQGRAVGLIDFGERWIELVGSPGYDAHRGQVRTTCRAACNDYQFFSGSEPGDAFGQVLAVVGDDYAWPSWLVVGAPGGDYVKVFRRAGNEPAWQEEIVLTASNGNPGDLFGYSVAADAHGSQVWVAVGAPQHANLAGAAYVFRRDPAGVWSQVAVVYQPSPQSGDLFGAAVAYRVSNLAVTDHLLAVGAPGRYPAGDSGVGYRRGTVSIYRQSPFPGDFGHDGDASFNTFLCASNAALCENREQAMDFGAALAFDGEDLWIGAPRYSQSDGANVGRVYRASLGPVFNNSGWWLRQMLSPGPLAEEDCGDQDPNVIGRDNGRFGTSLAAFGNGIAVGYPGRGCVRDVPPYMTYPRTGQVRIYGVPSLMFSDRFEP